MKTIRKKIGLLIAPIFFLSFTGNKYNLTFNDFDKNNDNLINEKEFVEVFTNNFYADWDMVDDEYLDDEDFHIVSYAIWDSDDDNLINEDEWIYGYENYYGDYIDSEFVAVDTDADGFINYDEYYSIIHDTDFYTTWDANDNAILSENEFAEKVFHTWDDNNTGYMTKNEYEDFDMFYFDI
ncbi:MAG TPA: hypothetical protein DDY13_19615 [Cytophagales bacterium]|nr:hypothetical protein [Cytophagales bacterium]